jgi:hypothetical protein
LAVPKLQVHALGLERKLGLHSASKRQFELGLLWVIGVDLDPLLDGAMQIGKAFDLQLALLPFLQRRRQ